MLERRSQWWIVYTIIVSIMVVVFGVGAFQANQRANSAVVGIYTAWMSSMGLAETYLSSHGPGETQGKPPTLWIDPNMALIRADSATVQAAAAASAASQAFNGKLGVEFAQMAGISQSFDQELQMMGNYGQFVHNRWAFLTPHSVSIADRRYMDFVLRHVILQGMPTNAVTVEDILGAGNHLQSLDRQGNTYLGISGTAFVKFMESTGQMRSSYSGN